MRALGARRGLVDAPGGRKAHGRPVPYLGGVAIVAALIATLTSTQVFGVRLALVGAAAALLGAVGLVDDWRPLGITVRLAAEVAAAAIATAGGVQVVVTGVAAVDVAITIVWIVGITNAINLLDNMDGLAGLVSLAAAVGICALAIDDGQSVIATASAALAGACAGFLVFNAQRASIFLGDSGALFLGFVLAVLSVEVNSALANPASYLIPIGLLGVPIADTVTVSVSRLRRGVSPFTPGHDHLSHRLVGRGLASGAAVATLATGQSVMVLLAVLAGQEVVALVPAVLGWSMVLAVILAMALSPSPAQTSSARRGWRR